MTAPPPTADGNLAWTVTGLLRKLGAHRLRIADLHIRRGCVTAILGGSGCGKSTLLHTLAGLDSLRPDDGGRITFHSAEGPLQWGPGEAPPVALRRWVGFVFQRESLIDYLNVADNLALPRRLMGLPPRPVHAALQDLGLREDFSHRNPADISGGEASRVVLLRALAHDPEVVLCDEPTADLDAHWTEDLLNRLVTWQRGAPNRTVVCVTHDLHSAFRWADDVLVWNHSAAAYERLDRSDSCAAWARAKVLVDCAWLGWEPPETGKVDIPADPPPPRPPTAPGEPDAASLLLLAKREFWRHARTTGKRRLQHGGPISLLLASGLLYLVLLATNALGTGTNLALQVEEQSPVFRMTTVQTGPRRGPGADGVLARLGVENAEFSRLEERFAADPGGGAAGPTQDIRVYGIAMDPRSVVYKAIVERLRSRNEVEISRLQTFTQRDPNAYDGVILTDALCTSLFGDERPADVRMRFDDAVSDPATGADIHRTAYPRMPLLGCASALPGFSFVTTLGYANAMDDAQGLFTDTFAIHPGTDWRDDGEGTAIAVRLGPAMAVRAREEVGPSGAGVVVRSGGGEVAGGGFQLVLRDPSGGGARLSHQSIRRAVTDTDPTWVVEFDPPSPFTSPPDFSRKDRWLVTIPLSMTSQEFQKLLVDAQAAGLTLDSGVLDRIESMARLGQVHRGYIEAVGWGGAVALSLLLGILWYQDGLRKVRSYGVLAALGLRPRHYLAIISLQVGTVQLLGFTFALAIHLVVLPVVAPAAMEALAGFRPQYPLAPSLWLTLGVPLLVAAGGLVLRYGLVARGHDPVELMRN